VLTPHPTYRELERATFYRSMSFIGVLLVAHGVPVIFDATGNRRAYRAAARAAIERFIEVYVDCPLEICVTRDPKESTTRRSPDRPRLYRVRRRPTSRLSIPTLSSLASVMRARPHSPFSARWSVGD